MQRSTDLTRPLAALIENVTTRPCSIVRPHALYTPGYAPVRRPTVPRQNGQRFLDVRLQRRHYLAVASKDSLSSAVTIGSRDSPVQVIYYEHNASSDSSQIAETIKREDDGIHDALEDSKQELAESDQRVGNTIRNAKRDVSNRPLIRKIISSNLQAPDAMIASLDSIRYRKAVQGRQKLDMMKHMRLAQRSAERSKARKNDWLQTLQTLEQWTPSGAEHHEAVTTVVKLSRQAKASFKQSKRMALLEILQRTSCHVSADVLSAHTEQHSAFRLRGTKTHIAAALDILPNYLHIDTTTEHGRATQIPRLLAQETRRNTATFEEVERHQYRNHKFSHEADPVNSVTARTIAPQPIDYFKDEIARSLWTVDRAKAAVEASAIANEVRDTTDNITDPLTFTTHIISLTQSVSRLEARIPNKARTEPIHTREAQIAKRLEALFLDPKHATFATSEAVSRAFQFCLRHGQTEVAQDVLLALSANKYKFLAEDFTPWFNACVRNGHLHLFDTVLKLMLQLDVQPTAMVWVQFYLLMSQTSTEHGDRILQLMASKGMLKDNRTAVMLNVKNVSRDLEAHLLQGGAWPSFIKLYDERWAALYQRKDFDWMHIDVLNRALGVLLANGYTDQAYQAVEAFEHRREGNRLKTATLNIFLTAAMRDGNVMTAIAALQHFHVGDRHAVKPDQTTFDILFKLAWRRHYYNVLRVIWRYACSAGHVSFAMRSKVFSSVADRSSSMSRVSRREIWQAWAGKFAVGVDSGLNSMADVQKQVTHISTVKELLSVANKDLTTRCHLMPSQPLVGMLEVAWRKDMEWKEKRWGTPRGIYIGKELDHFRELSEDGIYIPMRFGNAALAACS